MFFQALNAHGMAVQTMRTVTSVQAGQTLSCVGCHEPRNSTPRTARPLAAEHEASRIAEGPTGSWPLRFDALVQPVLDRSCVRCHEVGSKSEAQKLDLTAAHSYDNLLAVGQPCLRDHVRTRYAEGRSLVNGGAAQTSPILAKLLAPDGHHGLKLDADSLERLMTSAASGSEKSSGPVRS